MEIKDNIYVAELKKAVNNEVEVTTITGERFKGICKAINFTHLSLILMTDTQKIIIKNISHITRLRGTGKIMKVGENGKKRAT